MNEKYLKNLGSYGLLNRINILKNFADWDGLC